MTLVGDSFVLESFSTDFEPFQGTYFKDISEDCYLVKEKSCAGDELWKNASLPPTPPTSPSSSPIYSGTADESRCQQECKDDEEDLALCGETSHYFQTDNLKEILIKDCMWNGAAFDAGERKRSLHTRVERGRLLCQTPPLSESAARILSVDPTEIFPFPIHGNSRTADDESVELEQSGSDDDEEVEVDVVTIENSIKREEDEVKNLDGDDSVMAIESELSDFSTPFQSANEEQEDERDEFVGKIRHRRYRKSNSDGHSCSSRKSSSPKPQPNCSGESDESENEFTRATHNVLERKRRNDLKLKFQRLRDCVPELKDNERAPKVSILRKSWEYISTLKKEDSRLKQEYEKHEKTNALLMRQLLALNPSEQMI